MVDRHRHRCHRQARLGRSRTRAAERQHRVGLCRQLPDRRGRRDLVPVIHGAAHPRRRPRRCVPRAGAEDGGPARPRAGCRLRPPVHRTARDLRGRPPGRQARRRHRGEVRVRTYLHRTRPAGPRVHRAGRGFRDREGRYPGHFRPARPSDPRRQPQWRGGGGPGVAGRAVGDAGRDRDQQEGHRPEFRGARRAPKRARRVPAPRHAGRKRAALHAGHDRPARRCPDPDRTATPCRGCGQAGRPCRPADHGDGHDRRRVRHSRRRADRHTRPRLRLDADRVGGQRRRPARRARLRLAARSSSRLRAAARGGLVAVRTLWA